MLRDRCKIRGTETRHVTSSSSDWTNDGMTAFFASPYLETSVRSSQCLSSVPGASEKREVRNGRRMNARRGRTRRRCPAEELRSSLLCATYGRWIATTSGPPMLSSPSRRQRNQLDSHQFCYNKCFKATCCCCTTGPRGPRIRRLQHPGMWVGICGFSGLVRRKKCLYPPTSPRGIGAGYRDGQVYV